MASEENQIVPKTPMTDEERLLLCQKLDKELDDFIDGLEKKSYTEGWPEDRWEEEMEKHPFFMKTVPENGELSPMAEGLARLKFDPDENTPLELALNYKEDGNFNFQHKNYRLAIISYTEGIKQKADDPCINASLYNNRAQAQWNLKNYRSSLLDSEKALSFDPQHLKARLRAAKAALAVGKYDLCEQHCSKLDDTDLKSDALSIMKTVTLKRAVQERDERKKHNKAEKYHKQHVLVKKAIIDRGIRIANSDLENELDMSELEPSVPGADMVHIENNVLIWPVLIIYPEYQMTEFIKSCPENISLLCQLEPLFPAPWDVDNKYAIDKISVYTEGHDRMPHAVDPKKELGEILKQKFIEVKAGTPAFCVLPRSSDVERRFLQSFPHKPNLKEKWIEATGKKDWFPTKHSTICSIHFEEACFVEGKKQRIVTKAAYPTIDVLKITTGEVS